MQRIGLELGDLAEPRVVGNRPRHLVQDVGPDVPARVDVLDDGHTLADGIPPGRQLVGALDEVGEADRVLTGRFQGDLDIIAVAPHAEE